MSAPVLEVLYCRSFYMVIQKKENCNKVLSVVIVVDMKDAVDLKEVGFLS